MKWCIYTLIDPRSNIVRYVGFTSQKPCKRLSAHLYTAKHTKKPNHLTNWLNQVLSAGLKPCIEVVEQGTDPAIWPDAERRWIAQLRLAGVPLTNCADGGTGPVGVKRSPEFVENVRERARKTYATHGKALLEAARINNTGRTVSEETRQASSAAIKAAKLRDPGLNVAERNGRATITWEVVRQIRKMFSDLGGVPGKRTRRGVLKQIRLHFNLPFGIVQEVTQQTHWKENHVDLPSIDD